MRLKRIALRYFLIFVFFSVIFLSFIFISFELVTRIFYDSVVELPSDIRDYFNKFSDKSIKSLNHYPTGQEIALSDDGLAYDENGSLLSIYKFYHSKNYLDKSDIFRIAIIGDSFTQGAGVSQKNGIYIDGFIPALETQFSGKYVQGKKVEILPFAFAGINMRQKLGLLKEYFKDYDADLVVLQFCSNDFDPAITVFRPFPDDGTYLVFVPKKVVLLDPVSPVPSFSFLSYSQNLFLLKNSYFLRFLSFKINSKLSSARYGVANGFKDLNEFNSLVSSKEIPLVIINFPVFLRDNSTQCNKENNELLKLFSLKNGIPYADLCGYMQKEHRSNLNTYISDIHYNKQGYNVAAEITYSKIVFLLEDLGYNITTQIEDD